MFEFWLPMSLLFVAATITAIASRRKQDRCLKFFNREPVMILIQSGKWLWGRFITYPKTMELVFENPKVDESGHQKTSYVLYIPDIENIKKILQPAPTEGTKARGRWQQETKRIAHPSIFRRFRRWVWNVFNMLRDAVSQCIGMIIGTMKTRIPIDKVAGADKQASNIGATLLGAVPNSYEPVLEKYLSKQVVVETIENGEVAEFFGLLQEYSEKYLLLRDVPYQLDIDTGTTLPERFDIIFPRNSAIVRHCLE